MVIAIANMSLELRSYNSSRSLWILNLDKWQMQAWFMNDFHCSLLWKVMFSDTSHTAPSFFHFAGSALYNVGAAMMEPAL